MKAFSDFIAIILFIGTYIITKNMIAATTVAVVIGIFQAAFTYIKHKKLESMQWVSLVLVVVLGGLTISLNDPKYIMLKSTVVPWLMAAVMLVAQLRGKNGLRIMLAKEMELPDAVWNKLGYAWIAFFIFLGLVNIVVAYPFDETRQDIWAQFKLWGYMPLIITFSIAQAVYLVRHLPKEN